MTGENGRGASPRSGNQRMAPRNRAVWGVLLRPDDDADLRVDTWAVAMPGRIWRFGVEAKSCWLRGKYLEARLQSTLYSLQ